MAMVNWRICSPASACCSTPDSAMAARWAPLHWAVLFQGQQESIGSELQAFFLGYAFPAGGIDIAIDIGAPRA